MIWRQSMEKVEKSGRSIGKRIHRYLFDGGISRQATRDTVSHLAENLPGTVVFGGMVRDLGLASARTFNSDIDLVSLANRAEILAAIRHYNPVVNKFGGFRFVAGKQMFDIWSFEDTWAFKQGLVAPKTLQDLCLTTFFNLDGAFHPLKSNEVYGTSDFIASLHGRILDINLQENPSPQNMAARAINLAISRDLAISLRLLNFVLSNAASALWRDGPSRVFLELAKKYCEGQSDAPFRFAPQASFDIAQPLDSEKNYPICAQQVTVETSSWPRYHHPNATYDFENNSAFA